MRPQAKAQAKGDIIPLSLGFIRLIRRYETSAVRHLGADEL